MKLEVGMYVRTKEGNIEKICAIEGKHIYTNEDYLSWYNLCAISKASHNIIDLIEVGDYVNGHKITTINEMTPIVYAEDEQGYLIKIIPKEDIETIVTKEQFETMAYKVV